MPRRVRGAATRFGDSRDDLNDDQKVSFHNPYAALEQNIDADGEVVLPADDDDDDKNDEFQEDVKPRQPPQPPAEALQRPMVSVGARHSRRKAVAQVVAAAPAAIGHTADARGADEPVPLVDQADTVDMSETVASPTTVQSDLTRLQEIARLAQERRGGQKAEAPEASDALGDLSSGFIAFGGGGQTHEEDSKERPIPQLGDDAEDADDLLEMQPTAEAVEDAAAEHDLDEALEQAEEEDDEVAAERDEVAEADDDAADPSAVLEDAQLQSTVGAEGGTAGFDDAEGELRAALEKPLSVSDTVFRPTRQSVNNVTYEHREAVGFAAASVVALSKPLSLVGPCVVWPLVGAVSVAGAVTYPDSKHQPYVFVPDAGESRSQNTSKKKQSANPLDAVAVVPLPAKTFIPRSVKRNSSDAQASEHRDEVVRHLESNVTGAVEWAWVTRVVAEWRERLGSLPTTVLILKPAEEGLDAAAVTRTRMGQHRDHRLGAQAVVERVLPRSFAHYDAPLVGLPLYAATLPDMMKAVGSVTVCVVGQQGVGKSTLCRHVMNALISRHGSCLIVDLDVGQGELTPPGCVAVAKICQPVVSSRHGALAHGASAAAGGTVLACAYVGSAVVRDPLVAGQAIESVCAVARAASSEARLPIVVNTHGWVHGIGRRATIHAMQRLHPTHVIHLQLQADEDWVGEMAAAGQLAAGSQALSAPAVSKLLSSAVAGRLFLNSVQSPGRRDKRPAGNSSLSFELIRLPVPRQFDKTATKVVLRLDRWRQFFGGAAADGTRWCSQPPARVFGTTEQSSSGEPRFSYSRVRVPLSKIVTVTTDGLGRLNDAVPSSSRLGLAATVLEGNLVALGCLNEQDREAAFEDRVVHTSRLAAAVNVLSFAQVCGFETAHCEPITSAELRADEDKASTALVVLASCAPPALLHSAGCDAAVVGTQAPPKNLLLQDVGNDFE